MPRFTCSPTVTINYQTCGSGSIPVVLLHGFAASLATWHDLRDRFPPDRFRLFLLDLKGHGFSAKPRDNRYGIADQADIVRRFLAHLDLHDVVLAGHSMGGAIALKTVLDSRAGGDCRVGRLILLDAAAYGQPMPRFMRLMEYPLLGNIILCLPARFIVRRVLDACFFNKEAITPTRIARYMAGFSSRGVPYAFVTTVRQLVPPDYDAIVAAYPTIDLPTLLVWGERDPIVWPMMGERLHRDLPASKLVLIPACGHNPHEERPDETWAAIARFLEA